MTLFDQGVEDYLYKEGSDDIGDNTDLTSGVS